MFRIFRYIRDIYRLVKKDVKVKPGTQQYCWLKAYFTHPDDLAYISALVKELEAVELAIKPKQFMTWSRLWRFKSYDRNVFLGVDLVTYPTRGILCLLSHFGDISEKELCDRWDWAVARDQQLLSRKPVVNRHTHHVLLMRENVIKTHTWVNKRKRQCELNNNTPTRTD